MAIYALQTEELNKSVTAIDVFNLTHKCEGGSRDWQQLTNC